MAGRATSATRGTRASFPMRTVLVTGGAGFIGSHLVENLVRRGYAVRVLDNLSQGDRSYLDAAGGVEFIEGDVTDLGTCRTAVRDVEGIFHLAAMSKVFPSLGDPGMVDFCLQQNVQGTLNVLRAALERKSSIRKFIYSGSSTYYGANAPPQAEDQPPGWQTPYAMTKYMGEMNCELFTRLYQLPTVRLRYFMTYGPRQPSTGPYAVVTGVFMRQWEDCVPLTIMGDGHQTRDFIHVEDVAEGTVRAYESAVDDATINIGTGVSVTINDLADLFTPHRRQLPRREHDIPLQQADTTRMERLLGWRPRVDLREYLKSEIGRRLDESPGRYPEPAWRSAPSQS
jgi:nucleoside-diphosphate-sugar epimerase